MLRFGNITIAFSLAVLIFSACSDISPPAMPSEDRLLLRSITKWSVDINTGSKLNVVMYKEYDREGRLTIDEEYTNSGRLLSKSSHTYTGNAGKEILIEFDESGNQKQQSIFEYILDPIGRVIKKISFDLSGEICKEISYIYDELGNLIQRHEHNIRNNEVITYDYSYTFSSRGDLIERVIKSSNDNSFSRDSMVYSSGNLGLDIIHYDAQGIYNIRSYKYNSSGRIISETESSPDGTIIRKFVYEYSFYPAK